MIFSSKVDVPFGKEIITSHLNSTWQHQITINVDGKSPSDINIQIFDDDFGKPYIFVLKLFHHIPFT